MSIHLGGAFDRAREWTLRDYMTWDRVRRYALSSVPIPLLSRKQNADQDELPLRIRPVILILMIVVLLVLGLLGYVR